jgi:alpha-D-xyloside xylohydrolase
VSASGRLLPLIGAFVMLAVLATPAGASVSIGAKQIVVRTAGAQATITRSPFGVTYRDGRGRPVLHEATGAGGVLAVPPVAQSQFGRQSPPGPALYAPLGFLVGSHSVQQTPGSQWEGTLSSVTEGGVAYSPRAVIDARADGGGALMTLSTSDPTGRRLVVRVMPQGSSAVRISARPSPATGVVTMSDSFSSPSSEAFHGFGGRHDSLDQRGHEFYNWLQQENLSSGSAEGLVTPTSGDRYLFPNAAERRLLRAELVRLFAALRVPARP